MMSWVTNLLPWSPMKREARRERQNGLIKQMFSSWQLIWHDAYDKDAVLGATGAEFERPDPLPTEIQSDTRLIFGLCLAEPETLHACFAPFPKGADMRRRFESFLASSQTSLPEAEARALLAELARHVVKAKPNEELDWTRVEVVDRDAPGATERLSRAGWISFRDLFERYGLDPCSDRELPAVAARLFLTEPLYTAAGNYYDLRDWVTAAMFQSRHQDRVYELAYRLRRGGWRLFSAENGIILLRED